MANQAVAVKGNQQTIHTMLSERERERENLDVVKAVKSMRCYKFLFMKLIYTGVKLDTYRH